MKRLLFCLALIGLVQADPAHDYANITNKKKMQSFHYPLALYSPQLEEQSEVGGPKNLPVLALYFFRHERSQEEHKAFAAALADHKHGAGSEFPYAVLELGITNPESLSTKSIQTFNVGRCLNPASFNLTGAMLNDPTQKSQWKIELGDLSGELKDGGSLQVDLSFEHIASRYQAEFAGTVPVMLVPASRYQP
ncbi:MAG: hypothetical protein J0I12_25450 [Candidatus Eremiobacteraeota bacterium]|nr:hypothetical protein [Candidatus Eremiobacteraeota bacterium]